MPGAGFDRRKGCRRGEVDPCADDGRQIVVDDDAAVHLRQFAKRGRREVGVDREAAGGHLLDHRVGTQHDQGSGVTGADPLQPLAQWGAGREQRAVSPVPLLVVTQVFAHGNQSRRVGIRLRLLKPESPRSGSVSARGRPGLRRPWPPRRP
ncbi:hypothetical protein SDC9_201996 [bioreactor metagenome]|uniref:Uncharacterized protein n=1 Tax=bioreactor metagenome TaxID=1076179 RepID=A0A645IT53_9ZZZZ